MSERREQTRPKDVHRTRLPMVQEGRRYFLRREPVESPSSSAPPAWWASRPSLLSVLSARGSALLQAQRGGQPEQAAPSTSSTERRRRPMRTTEELSVQSSAGPSQHSALTEVAVTSSDESPSRFENLILHESSEGSTHYSPGRRMMRLSSPEPREVDVHSLAEEHLQTFLKLQVTRALLKRMGMLAKPRVETADGALQEVRFYEGLHGEPPPEPASAFKVVFKRTGPAAGPWRLYDYRMPVGIKMPPTDGLERMASLREARPWLRAVLKALRAHQLREAAFQTLREDPRLFPDPSKQVYSISSTVLSLKFQFPVPAERRIIKSSYNLRVGAVFAGDCSLLPESIKVFRGRERAYPLEDLLAWVRDDFVERRSRSPRLHFDSPLVEVVHGWWNVLATSLADAERAQLEEELEEAETPPHGPHCCPDPAISRSPSSEDSSFDLVVSPCARPAAAVRRRRAVSSSPSPPRGVELDTPRAASPLVTPGAASPPATPRAASPPRTPRAVSPSGTPRTASPLVIPRVTPRAASSRAPIRRAATPWVSRGAAFRRDASPSAATPPATPRATPRVTARTDSPPVTPRSASPLVIPRVTPRAASPTSPIRRAASPWVATRRAAIRRGASPTAASPPATPRVSPRAASPRLPTRRTISQSVATRRAASPRAATPWAASQRGTSPHAADRSATSPRAATSMVATPHADADVQQHFTPKRRELFRTSRRLLLASPHSDSSSSAASPRAASPRKASRRAAAPWAATRRDSPPHSSSPTHSQQDTSPKKRGRTKTSTRRLLLGSRHDSSRRGSPEISGSRRTIHRLSNSVSDPISDSKILRVLRRISSSSEDHEDDSRASLQTIVLRKRLHPSSTSTRSIRGPGLSHTAHGVSTSSESDEE